MHYKYSTEFAYSSPNTKLLTEIKRSISLSLTYLTIFMLRPSGEKETILLNSHHFHAFFFLSVFYLPSVFAATGLNVLFRLPDTFHCQLMTVTGITFVSPGKAPLAR